MVSPQVCLPSPAPNASGHDVELADVVRRFGPNYRSQYGPQLMPSQRRALADIATCCTAERGGRRYHCDDCCQSFWSYHCCRNRACPKCHGRQTRHVPPQAAQQRHLANDPAARRGVSAALPAARPAARLSPSPLLRTLAPWQARLGKPRRVAPHAGDTDRQKPSPEGRGPARSLELTRRA